MIETIGIILLNLGTLLGIWGYLWRLWNKRSMASGVLMALGIVMLTMGWVMM